MSTSLEFKAKNVDQAVERASAELKMPKKQIRYEVISYGSSGIFGLSGAKKAKIRVQLPKDYQLSAPQTEAVEFEADSTAAVDKSRSSTAMDPFADNAVAKENAADQPLYPFPDDPEETGRLVLQRIINSISTDAQISVENDGDGICFNVNGGNAGILIGKRGQTLDAIQTIIEKVVNKRNQNRIRVLVDIEGYLDTRKENLENLALRLAEKAKRIGKPISMGQMNAYDRRIVHLALQDFSGVQTRSRGEGPLRKLVIFPKKKNSSGR
jgi:spoIIIJ-associated protein